MEEFSNFYLSPGQAGYRNQTQNTNQNQNPAPLPNMVFGEYFNQNNTNTNTQPNPGPTAATQNNLTINDIYIQNQQLQNQVNALSASLISVQNLSNASYRAIETILNQQRYLIPLRQNSRFRPRPYYPYNPYRYAPTFEPREQSQEAYLERLNNLINLRHSGATQARGSNLNHAETLNMGANQNIPNQNQNNEAQNANANANANANTPSRVEALIFRSLVDSLNNQLPNVNAQMHSPNILEVSYSTENISNDIVNFIRNLNDGETPENIITTHATISHNTEVDVFKNSDSESESELNSDSNVQSESVNENPSSTSASPNDKICVICQEEFEDLCIVRKIKKCGHYFHIGCLDRWLETKITCPTCRADIRLNLNNSDENEEDMEL